MTGVWVTGDLITAARLNEKGILSDTNANILVATLYSGMMVFPTDTSTLNANQPYIRNNANTAWIGIATLGANTFTADQTIGGNKIKTANHSIYETSAAGFNTILLQPNSALGELLTLASGTTTNVGIQFFRTSDITTNMTGIRLGVDFDIAGQWVLKIFNGGTGVLLPLIVYMGATKLFSFDVANTITSYVPLTISIAGNAGLILTSTNTIGPSLSIVGATVWGIRSTSTGDAEGANNLVITNVGGSYRAMLIDAGANVAIGKAGALATNATDGFLHIPSGAGAPTGVPTTFAGKIPLYYDSTNNFLYVYNGGWKKSTVYA